MTVIESRDTWGARKSKGSTRIFSTRGIKAHYTGSRVDPATVIDHGACRKEVRDIQSGHMDGRGWNDIGYSMIVCAHDIVMVGRGPGVLPAANGAGLNSDHYAVLFLVGNSGVTVPTPGMKTAFHAARDYLIQFGGAGSEIRGHRDGYATDCPGDPVYGWIQIGAPLPASPVPPTPTGDQMRYSAYSLPPADAYEIPRDVWTDVKFSVEHADPDGDHAAGLYPTIIKGAPTIYSLEFGGTLSGASTWDSAEIRTAEFSYSAGPPAVDTLVETGPVHNVYGPDLHHSAVGSVQAGRKLRVQIRHNTPGVDPVMLTGANVRIIHQR